MNQKLVTEMLGYWGSDYSTANNGLEAIKQLSQKEFQLIISDIMMPIENGITLCNTLKNDKLTSHIPIILLTAKAGEKNEIDKAISVFT